MNDAVVDRLIEVKSGDRLQVTEDGRQAAARDMDGRPGPDIPSGDSPGSAYEDTEGIVFTQEDGQRVSPNAISKAFLRAQAGLELPRISMHSARHSHATLLLRDKVPVHIVAKRLGHKDPSVTLNVYADVMPDDDSSAVDVFSTAVWGV